MWTPKYVPENQMTHKSHFVSVFYLKQFLIKNEHLLAAYNCFNNKFYRSKPENLCFENDAYETIWGEDQMNRLGKYLLTNDIENYFAQREIIYSQLQKRLINICMNPKNNKALVCSADDKTLLCEWVLNFLVRHPCRLKEIGKISNYNFSEISPDVIELFKLLGFGSPDAIFKHVTKRAYLTSLITNGPFQQMQEELRNMNCVFCISNATRFITSSMPVALIEGPHVYFPISPYLVVIFTPLSATQRINRSNRILNMTQHVNEMNNFYVDIVKQIDVNLKIIGSTESDLDAFRS